MDSAGKYRKDLGRQGEDIACDFLRRRGYRIIERNYIGKTGEIDIVALDESVNGEGVLTFVEVKSRCDMRYGSPAEAVTRRKLQHVVRSAELYLAKHRQYAGYSCRVDVIEVLLNERRIRHIKNVTV